MAADRLEIAHSIRRRMFTAMVGSNLVGGAVALVFAVYIVPVPSGLPGDLERTNLLLFAATLAVTIPLGTVLGQSRHRPVRNWLESGEPPSAQQRLTTLRQPLEQAVVNAWMWAAAGVVFVAVNASESAPLGAIVAVTAVLGAFTTCALCYGLAERVMRPATALALASEVPVEPAGPGVSTRMFLAWALGAGIPLVAVALVTVAVLSGVDVSAERLAGSVLFLAAVGLAVGLLATSMVARSVSEPLGSLRSAVRDVERGSLDADVEVEDASEVGLLQAGFNRMVAGLRERERLQDLFGRHVGEDVARRALRDGVHMGGESVNCAVLFVDLVGSTSLAASRPATEVVALLNRFFGVVVEVTQAHGGWVNKFEGDAALCVFGAPTPQDDPAGLALAAARELCTSLAEVPELRAGIGVSAGSAVAGNIGAAERFEYTVIGDPVNEAARLTELAKTRDGVLASEAAVAAAGREEAKRWRLEEEVTLRGRGRPTRLAVPVAGGRTAAFDAATRG